MPALSQLRPASRAGSPSSPSPGAADDAAVTAIPMSAQRLGAPPRDVERLLAHYGTALPRYLDAQRWRAVERAHRHWPLMRTGSAAGTRGAS